MSSARQTVDHDEKRRWIEETLGPIEGEAFFRTFERSNLAFLHQDKTEDGKLSKFVSRS